MIFTPASLRRSRECGSLFVAALLCTAAIPTALCGQVAVGTRDTTVLRADPGDVLGSARAAQAVFERRRVRYLPLSLGSSGGICDEYVGRFCTWYSEGEWYPTPERDEIVQMRSELIAHLDSLQALSLTDDWILGQRVWYRSETGAWDAALASARDCGSVEGWWCAALEGFALHGLGNFTASANAFARALSQMKPAQALSWRLPGRAIDPSVRRLLEDLEADPDSLARVLDRVWSLADPLYLVAGNDRLTAHYARWTVATLRERARNPFHIRWGSDLEELTIRHGWEMGWERSPARGSFSSLDHVVGHKHPEGRDYMPSLEAIEHPASAPSELLTADRRRPRSLYSPAYAPVLLPMEGQVALFPRGETTVVVTTHFLPDDTTFHAEHHHPLPWMEPGEQADMPDRIGLFAVPVDGGPVYQRVARGRVEGTLMLEVPTSDYVISAESWSPERRRAGRFRVGVAGRAAPDDVVTLSDILLLRPSETEPEELEAAVGHALARPRIRPGQTFAIGWEVMGLGFRREVVRFEVSIERTDRGVLSRLGAFFHLSDRPQPLVLSWEEAGPYEPTYYFRYLNLDLPQLDPGSYEIRLVLSTAERSDAVATRAFEVVER